MILFGHSGGTLPLQHELRQGLVVLLDMLEEHLGQQLAGLDDQLYRRAEAGEFVLQLHEPAAQLHVHRFVGNELWIPDTFL